MPVLFIPTEPDEIPQFSLFPFIHKIVMKMIKCFFEIIFFFIFQISFPFKVCLSFEFLVKGISLVQYQELNEDIIEFSQLYTYNN